MGHQRSISRSRGRFILALRHTLAALLAALVAGQPCLATGYQNMMTTGPAAFTCPFGQGVTVQVDQFTVFQPCQTQLVNGPGLNVQVNSGSVAISNNAGTTTAGPGQSGSSSGPTSSPQTTHTSSPQTTHTPPASQGSGGGAAGATGAAVGGISAGSAAAIATAVAVVAVIAAEDAPPAQTLKPEVKIDFGPNGITCQVTKTDGSTVTYQQGQGQTGSTPPKASTHTTPPSTPPPATNPATTPSTTSQAPTQPDAQTFVSQNKLSNEDISDLVRLANNFYDQTGRPPDLVNQARINDLVKIATTPPQESILDTIEPIENTCRQMMFGSPTLPSQAKCEVKIQFQPSHAPGQQPATLKPGNECQIDIKYSPTESGPKTGQLQISKLDEVIVTGSRITDPAVTTGTTVINREQLTAGGQSTSTTSGNSQTPRKPEIRIDFGTNGATVQITKQDGTTTTYQEGKGKIATVHQGQSSYPEGPGSGGSGNAQQGTTPTPTPTPTQQPAVDPKKLEQLRTSTSNERDSLLQRADEKIGGLSGDTMTSYSFKLQFPKLVQKFEERAVQQGLSTDEVKGVYREAQRLFDQKAPQGPQRDANIYAAYQIIAHAANPYGIDQGNNPTCNVTTVEVRLFTLNPAAISKMIADLVITGKYTTADGTKIELTQQDRTVGDEEKRWYISDFCDKRSFASQIAQIGLINIHYKHNDSERHYGRFERPAGSQPPGIGEGLFKGTEFQGASPQLGTTSYQYIFNQVAGGSQTGFILSRETDVGNGVVSVRNVDDLKTKLEKMQADGKFPSIVRVHTRNEPFWADSGGGDAGGAGGEQGGWHVVNVTGYDPQTGLVSIDNQWGSRKDHLNGDKRIDVATLFTAMEYPQMRSGHPRSASTPNEAPMSLGQFMQTYPVKIELVGDGGSTEQCDIRLTNTETGDVVTTSLNTVCVSTKLEKPPPPLSIAQSAGLEFSINTTPDPVLINIYQQSLKMAAAGEYANTPLAPDRAQQTIAQMAIWKYMGDLSGRPEAAITQTVIKNDVLAAAKIDASSLTTEQSQAFDQRVATIFNAANLTIKNAQK